MRSKTTFACQYSFILSLIPIIYSNGFVAFLHCNISLSIRLFAICVRICRVFVPVCLGVCILQRAADPRTYKINEQTNIDSELSSSCVIHRRQPLRNGSTTTCRVGDNIRFSPAFFFFFLLLILSRSRTKLKRLTQCCKIAVFWVHTIFIFLLAVSIIVVYILYLSTKLHNSHSKQQFNTSSTYCHFSWVVNEAKKQISI